MASSAKESRKVLEGVLAINKPQWASSAGVLRDLQEKFASPQSTLLKPWLDSQRRNLILAHAKRRHIDNLKVKLGHGGTLDPMATGVLIVGVGKGTKHLQKFLECTKTYECVVLFGAATDSYDAVGKIVSKADYEHVTKELVEEKLAQFCGKIKQKPSVFSALKVDGKKMYEYAREGKDIPEVAARDVEVHELELVEWLEPGTHEYSWPKEEADKTEQAGAEKLMGIRKQDADAAKKRGRKRSRSLSPETDHVTNADDHPKKPKTDDEPAMSGALPIEENVQPPEEETTKPDSSSASAPSTEPVETTTTTTTEPNSLPSISEPTPQPPAARLRMTVTSGFYVRSLCHDLGLACSSLGLMSSLVRSRQGDYSLGKNVLEYSDLDAEPAVWEPKIAAFLEEFMEREGWVPEEVEDEETWRARRKEREGERREGDRERSFRGGGRGRGRGGSGGKGRGGRNFYSKDMRGGRDD